MRVGVPHKRDAAREQPRAAAHLHGVGLVERVVEAQARVELGRAAKLVLVPVELRIAGHGGVQRNLVGVHLQVEAQAQLHAQAVVYAVVVLGVGTH